MTLTLASRVLYGTHHLHLLNIPAYFKILPEFSRFGSRDKQGVQKYLKKNVKVIFKSRSQCQNTLEQCCPRKDVFKYKVIDEICQQMKKKEMTNMEVFEVLKTQGP